MQRSFYKKATSHLFHWWLEKDLKKFLQQVEDMSLKNAVEQKVANGTPLSAMEEWKGKMWEYGTYMAEHVYKEGQPPGLESTVHRQAESAVEALVPVFLHGLKEEHAIAAFFPSPPEQKQGQERDTSILNRIQNLVDTYGFEQTLLLVKQEKNLLAAVNAFFREHVTFMEKRLFKPKEKHYIMLVWNLLFQAAEDIKRFSRKHQLTFSHDGEIRCFYNMLNLYLHYFAIHGRVIRKWEDRELVFAASALHPLQDDYLDETEPSREAVHAIQEKVNGRAAPFIDEKTRGIFDLIDVIYESYPVKENPMLVTIFSKLHEYQSLSAAQKDENLSDEQLLRLSFMKGGYAFAFFGYMVHGAMSIAQFHHFFIIGAIFQLLDDFHDIEEDLESGSATVWTRAVEKGEKVDHILNATIALQRYYENHTSLVREFTYPVFIRKIELFGIRYDTFRFFTMNESYFSEGYVKEFKNSFPFSLDIPKKIYTSSQPYERIDMIIKLLEEWKTLFMK